MGKDDRGDGDIGPDSADLAARLAAEAEVAGVEPDADIDPGTETEGPSDPESVPIDPDDIPTVVHSANDPFVRARAALRDAALARGADPDAEPAPAPRRADKGDPLAAARNALAGAAAVRDEAAKGGRAGVAREAKAREELARLKADGVAPAATPATPGDDPPEAERPKKPRTRRL